MTASSKIFVMFAVGIGYNRKIGVSSLSSYKIEMRQILFQKIWTNMMRLIMTELNVFAMCKRNEFQCL